MSQPFITQPLSYTGIRLLELSYLDIPKNEIHIWIANPDAISHKQMEARYYNLLSSEEQNRYRRFHFVKDRRIYLSAHVFVRAVLSRYTRILPELICFSYGIYGKPQLDLPDLNVQICYNLTHTHGMIGCVITQGNECGIDLEAKRTIQGMGAIMSQLFSPDEINLLSNLDRGNRIRHFYYIWTLKEAYAKATGVGINTNLKRVSFVVCNNRVTVDFDETDCGVPDQWSFYLGEPTENHSLAVAVRSTFVKEFVLMKDFSF